MHWSSAVHTHMSVLSGTYEKCVAIGYLPLAVVNLNFQMHIASCRTQHVIAMYEHHSWHKVMDLIFISSFISQTIYSYPY